jgi:hypothetical protein
VSTLVLFVIFCCASIGLLSCLIWAVSEAAKRGDEEAERHHAQADEEEIVRARGQRPQAVLVASQATVQAVACESELHAVVADLAWCDVAQLDAIIAWDLEDLQRHRREHVRLYERMVVLAGTEARRVAASLMVESMANARWN